jgi:peroxiredoxin Q/BCP
MPVIEEGRPAPSFALPDQDGTMHRLKDYAGRPVVLYFYPKDDTPGCTTEACAFRDAHLDFGAANAVVLGVSALDGRSKAKFAKKHGLNFPLLADEDHAAADAYGAWQEKSMYGRKYMGVARITYLIGRDGRVARRWDKVSPSTHASDVLEAVRNLRTPGNP